MRWPGFVAANAAGGLLWASFYSLGAYALGNAASSVGSTITIAGYAVASVATVASFIMVRRSLRRLERRAEEASVSRLRRLGLLSEQGSGGAAVTG